MYNLECFIVPFSVSSSLFTLGPETLQKLACLFIYNFECFVKSSFFQKYIDLLIEDKET